MAAYDHLTSTAIKQLWEASEAEDFSPKGIHFRAQMGAIDGMREYYGRNRRHTKYTYTDDEYNVGLSNRIAAQTVPQGKRSAMVMVTKLLEEQPPQGKAAERDYQVIKTYLAGKKLHQIGTQFGFSEGNASLIIKKWTDMVKGVNEALDLLDEHESDDLESLMAESFS